MARGWGVAKKTAETRDAGGQWTLEVTVGDKGGKKDKEKGQKQHEVKGKQEEKRKLEKQPKRNA